MDDDDALIAAIIDKSNRLMGRGLSLRKPATKVDQFVHSAALELQNSVACEAPDSPLSRTSNIRRRRPIQREDRQTAEAKYSKVASAVHRKSFGQYFTPPNVASLMADWISQIKPRSVLDPALGTGVLVRACLAHVPKAQVTAYELDADVLRFADVERDAQVRIHNQDFLRAPLTERFDAVIMNPPYIRHREFEGYEEVRAALSVKSGFVVPRSANLYIYFAMKAALQLNPGGRASVLIPTEWMNANFATTFKRFLLDARLLREVVLFSGCSNIFEDALTTASVLFLEKSE